MEANIGLENEIDDLKKELRDGRREIEKTTDDFLKLKVKLHLEIHLILNHR